LPDNHKPSQAPDAPANARLKPSIPGDASSYDLTFPDKDGRPEYAFAGTRNTGDGQYVLYFDPEREAFVLDRIDSTFNMNITRVPGNSDPDALGRKYPHLDNDGRFKEARATSKPKAAEAKAKPLVAKARARSPPRKKDAPAASSASQKAEKKQPAPLKQQQPKQQPKQPPKSFELALPKPDPKPKPAPKSKARVSDDEDEDEDDDGGLLVEYPGVEPRAQKKDFSPAFQTVRRFDDFMDQRESEADDADGESDDDPEDFKLPSPEDHNVAAESEAESEPEMEAVSVADAMDEDEASDQEQPMPRAGDQGSAEEDDLANDLEMAFAAEDGGQDESEVSEED
jgi:hypothetical protein